MKGKSGRDIPVFARAAKPKPGSKEAHRTEAGPAARPSAPPPPPVRVKPQTTSAKSGQRGK